MTDNAKPIRILALTAIVLQAISTLFFCIVHLIPAPFLNTFGVGQYPDHPEAYQHVLLFVIPLLRMIVVFIFGYFLRKESTKPSSAAPVLLILILVSTVVLVLFSICVSTLANVLISRMYSTADMAVVSILNTVSGCAELITAPVMPMLAAAAGINYCKHRNALT